MVYIEGTFELCHDLSECGKNMLIFDIANSSHLNVFDSRTIKLFKKIFKENV